MQQQQQQLRLTTDGAWMGHRALVPVLCVCLLIRVLLLLLQHQQQQQQQLTKERRALSL